MNVTHVLGVGKTNQLTKANASSFKSACQFNEMLQNLFPFGKVLICKKGAYRFKTDQEANEHQKK